MRSIVRANKTDGEKGGGGGGRWAGEAGKREKRKTSFRGGASQPARSPSSYLQTPSPSPNKIENVVCS